MCHGRILGAQPQLNLESLPAAGSGELQVILMVSEPPVSRVEGGVVLLLLRARALLGVARNVAYRSFDALLAPAE